MIQLITGAIGSVGFGILFHIKKKIQPNLMASVLNSIGENIPKVLCEQKPYIKEILEDLGEITGEVVTEDIINEIFSKFCLGK